MDQLSHLTFILWMTSNDLGSIFKVNAVFKIFLYTGISTTLQQQHSNFQFTKNG